MPITCMYLCTFDCSTTSVARTLIDLRVDGTNYNPYAADVGGYQQATYTELVYLTAGQVIDWYCSLGGIQSANVRTATSGGGKGISFALIH